MEALGQADPLTHTLAISANTHELLAYLLTYRTYELFAYFLTYLFTLDALGQAGPLTN